MAGEAGTIGLKIQVPARIFGRVLDVLDAPFAGERGAQAIAEMRKSVAQEFAAGGHSTPEGGFRPWAQNVPFGTRELSNPPLGGASGFLARAWAGGEFGFQEQSASRVAIGIDHPAAPVHRGGEQAQEEISEQRPTDPQLTFLRAQYGVRVGRSTVLRTPSRPHATRNPDLEKAVAAIFERALSGAS